MSNILITVDDQNLHITDSPKIAAQGVKENYVVFNFSDDWTGFGKTAIFYAEEDPETVYQSIVDANDAALIPWEVTNAERKICLGVSGVKGDVVKTSEILKYKIVHGLYVTESAPPSPGMYEQMVALAGAIENQLNDTPYTTFEEEGEYELPVHTINDEEISEASTWSSRKILDAIYPIGSIYMSVNNTNPAALFGGTWASWGAGRVPVGVNAADTDFATVEKTGGSKTVTLNVNQIPSHNHTYEAKIPAYLTSGVGTGQLETFMVDSNMETFETNVRGGGQAHNNLQPYITCYMWKRTA